MAHTKESIIERLSQVHDQIKEHPFRANFSNEYASDYKYLLYKLTEIWTDYIYYGEYESEQEKIIRRQFGEWIHNYRQELRTYVKTSFPMRWFDYYERMLQVTHNFINTGELNEFYSIDYLWNDKHRRLDKVVHFRLVTVEECGVDNPILPKFFPVDADFCTDEQTARAEMDSEGYPFRNWSEEEMARFWTNWRNYHKPVLEWLNSQHQQSEYKYPAWKSYRIFM